MTVLQSLSENVARRWLDSSEPGEKVRAVSGSFAGGKLEASCSEMEFHASCFHQTRGVILVSRNVLIAMLKALSLRKKFRAHLG